jgi:hypothetical protein
MTAGAPSLLSGALASNPDSQRPHPSFTARLTFLPGRPWERVYTNWLSFHRRNARQSDLPAVLAPQRPQLPGMLVRDAIDLQHPVNRNAS